MDSYNLSIDGDSLENSRGETLVDRLRHEVRQKENIIEEKNKIISSLRGQVDDLQTENEEFEKNEQILKQKHDRCKKELDERNEELEAVSRTARELEAANETLKQRLDGRIGQLQKYVDDLKQTKKILDEAQLKTEELQNQNERLTVELESLKRKQNLRCRERDSDEADTREIQELRAQINSLTQRNQALVVESQKQLQHLRHHQEDHEKTKLANEVSTLKELVSQLEQKNENLLNDFKNARKNTLSASNQEPSNEELIQELYDLRAQVKSLSHRQSRRSVDEEITRLKEELNVTETSWKLERQHKERYARENCQLSKQVHELTKELSNIKECYSSLEGKYFEIENRLREVLSQSMPPPPPSAVKRAHVAKQDENRTEITSAMQFSVADEVGEIMDSSSIASTVKEKRCLNESKLWDQHGLGPKRAANDTLNGKLAPSSRSFFANPNVTKSQLFEDPIAEQKMRQARAKELARRNNLTKPLHQTSYPLELDTFDATNLTETEIKRGNVPRQALSDFSNQVRRPVKKAEAFIV